MTSKYVPPAINLVSFNCPHSTCGALAKQFWFSAHADWMEKGRDAQGNDTGTGGDSVAR
ncbi:MAG: hypothetical protein KC766_23775 [Myxococcales bacterium]|nr:hypothetical protein [Myxococcales bacterium]